MVVWITRVGWSAIVLLAFVGSLVAVWTPGTAAVGVRCQVDTTRARATVDHNTEDTTSALVVFVRFKDDTFSRFCDDGWDSSLALSEVPGWAKSLIDSPGTEPFSEGGLTHFFWEMSTGKHLLVGDVYDTVVVPPRSSGWYKDTLGVQIDSVNKWVVEYLDADTAVHLWKYDTNPQDSVVDVILLIYRWSPWHTSFCWGQADLFDGSITVDDSIEVNGGTFGSGTHQQGLNLFDGRAVCSHEYGHLLFRGARGMNAGHWDEFDRFGLMVGGQDGGNSMCAFERLWLGWIEPDSIGATKYDIEIGDMVTIGEAVKVQVADTTVQPPGCPPPSITVSTSCWKTGKG